VETQPVKEQDQAEDDENFEEDWNNAPPWYSESVISDQ
jgi:hypothetical protein